MRKSLLIFLLLVSTLLYGCNTPEVLPTATITPEWTATPMLPTETPTATPTATNTPLPPELDVRPAELSGMALTLRHALFGSEAEKLSELAEVFNQENEYGLRVSVERVSEEEVLFSGEKGQTAANVIIASEPKFRAVLENTFTAADLRPYLNNPETGIETAIMPGMMDETSDVLNALPLWQEPAFLFYNKTWAQVLGFPETPRSFGEFAEQACAAGSSNYAAEELDLHGTGGWIVDSDPLGVVSWMLNFGAADESVTDFFAEGENGTFTEAVRWLRNLFDNGCAWNARLTEPYDYFANRFALFYSGTYADAEKQLRAFDSSENYSMDNWDLIPYPRKTKDGEPLDPRIYSEGISVILPEQELKSQYAAWLFVQWLYSGTHAAELALSAGGWPVQDSDAVTNLYRNSGKDKLYQTLSWRQYIYTMAPDSSWLTDRLILGDGFGYVFNPSAGAEQIPQIWQQIGETAEEIRKMR